MEQGWLRTMWVIRVAAVTAVAAALSAILVVRAPGAWFLPVAIATIVIGAIALIASFTMPARRVSTADRQTSAVLDAVDDAVVLSVEGRVETANDALFELFEFERGAHIGGAYSELLRAIARKLEDPEGFMELYQPILADPDAETRGEVEQVLPRRRHLRVHSRPARADDARPIGRIDLFLDISDARRRAAQVEDLLERARRTADSFQRGLLPQAVPKLPRIGLVAYYVSCSGERSVCGDFYDFVPLVDGRVGLVVGDVCGSGPAAANDAAMARYSLRSFATDTADTGELLARLNRHIAANVRSERFVRLVLCVLDPERAVLEYANAGHVPPVLFRSKTSAVEWLSEGGIVLGVDDAADYKAARIDLEPGDTLVMYTDGVTEASRHGRPFGQGKFGDLVKEYGVGTAGELVQAIRRAVEAWTPEGQLRDDVAMLVCEVVPDETISEPTRELVVPNDSARLGDIRTFVATFLADLRAPVDASQEILVAAGEAAANATRHGGRPDRYSEIRVLCALQGPNVAVTVVDEGAGFFDAVPPLPDEPPDKFASGGRGLFLMQRLMDDVDIASTEGGTTVTMWRRLFESAPAGAAPPSGNGDRPGSEPSEPG